jgi:hypothetical protein
MFEYKIAQVEFGMDLVRQVWCPFIWKQCFPDVKIRVTSAHYFPEEITSQFCDEFVVEQNVKEKDTIIVYNSLRDRIKKMVPKTYYRNSIKMPDTKTTTDEPYVCFVPLLSDYWDDKPNIKNRSGGASVPFKNWMEYKRIVNEKGYKVFVLGNTKEIGYENIPEEFSKLDLGDYHFYREGENNNIHYVWKQIQIMQHAKFTIGMGGGGLVAPSFGLPCVSVDKIFQRHFTHKFPYRLPKYDILHEFKTTNKNEMIKQTNEFVLSCLEKRL